MALGFAGVLLGVPLSLGTGNLALLGLSLFGLTAGTLMLKRFCAEVPPFPSTAVQLIGGALASVLLMLAFETPHWRWTAHFAAALAWNTLAMSIIGMAIYNLMLDRLRRRPRIVGLLRGARRLRPDGLCAAERAPVGAGDRRPCRIDAGRRAGVAGGDIDRYVARRRDDGWNFSAPAPLPRRFSQSTEDDMTFGKGALLWLIGIPLPIILLLALFWR